VARGLVPATSDGRFRKRDGVAESPLEAQAPIVAIVLSGAIRVLLKRLREPVASTPLVLGEQHSPKFCERIRPDIVQ
jgi:hypothetical protein